MDETKGQESTLTEPAGDEQFVVGLANISEGDQVAIGLGDSIVNECEKLGMKVIRVNNEADGQKAVRNVEDLLTMGIDALIDFNIDASVGPVIMEKCDEAGIPVFAIDIPMEGAAFFGANNMVAGELAGEYSAQLVKDEWGGKVDGVLVVEQISSGEMVMQRKDGFIKAFKEALPDVTDEMFGTVDFKGDLATLQQAVSDYTGAHPDQKLIVYSITDGGARAAAAAIEMAGWQDDVFEIMQNENFFLEHVQNNPEEDFFRAAVAYRRTEYGRWLAPAVRKVLDGADLPEAIYIEHVVVDRENMAEIFPDSTGAGRCFV